MAQGGNRRRRRRGGAAQDGSECDVDAAADQDLQAPAAPDPHDLAAHELHKLRLTAAEQSARLAEAAKQLQTLEEQLAFLSAAVPATEDNTTAMARLSVSITMLRVLLHGPATATPADPTPTCPAPPAFPLLDLPTPLYTAICQLALSAPAIRLTCKALYEATPSQHLRPIQSPDQPDAAFAAAIQRPARLAALTSLDLSDVTNFGTHSEIAELAATHSTALRSLTLKNKYKLPQVAAGRAASLRALELEAYIDRAGELSSLSSLTALRSLALVIKAGTFFKCEEQDASVVAACLLSPVLSHRGLTRLELTLDWTVPEIECAILAATAVPLIASSLPGLRHLSLLPDAAWDRDTLGALATLTALTALGVQHGDSSSDAASHLTFLRPLAALPCLAAVTLVLNSSSAAAVRTLFQRTAHTPLCSITLALTGHTQPLDLVTSALGAAPSLTHLALSGCLCATHSDLAQLVACAPALRSLGLQDLQGVPDSLSTVVAGLLHLTALTIIKCPATTLHTLYPLTRLRRLQSFTTDLAKTCGLGIIGRLTQLTSLALHGMLGGVEQLAELTRLQRLQQLRFVERHPEYGFSVDDVAVCAVLMRLTALRRCMHPSWGEGKACGALDMRRRFALKSIPG